MRPDQLAQLRAEPEVLVAAAAAAEGRDPLAAATALRARGVPAELAAAALTQVELRARARGKFGADAGRMFFTRAGLEQATRGSVAERRAARLSGSGVRTLLDLGCGIGADALAAARAGITVTAVEADPGTAAVAEANAAAFGLRDRLTVVNADATTVEPDTDAVFCDPARRRGTSRVFDPSAYSPPWTFITALAARVPKTVLKLAPGIDHGLIPEGAEAEWVSVGGDVVEAAFWCGPLAEVPRRAALVGKAELTGTGEEKAPVAPPKRYLYDPDGAVVRSHLVAEFAATVGGTLADPDIAYVYADQPGPTPFARCLEIEESLPFSLKRLRAALRARGVGRVEILKRGSAVDVERLRRDLRLAGAEPASIVLTRVAGAPTAFIGRPVA